MFNNLKKFIQTAVDILDDDLPKAPSNFSTNNSTLNLNGNGTTINSSGHSDANLKTGSLSLINVNNNVNSHKEPLSNGLTFSGKNTNTIPNAPTAHNYNKSSSQSISYSNIPFQSMKNRIPNFKITTSDSPTSPAASSPVTDRHMSKSNFSTPTHSSNNLANEDDYDDEFHDRVKYPNNRHNKLSVGRINTHHIATNANRISQSTLGLINMNDNSGLSVYQANDDDNDYDDDNDNDNYARNAYEQQRRRGKKVSMSSEPNYSRSVSNSSLINQQMAVKCDQVSDLDMSHLNDDEKAKIELVLRRAQEVDSFADVPYVNTHM